MYTEIVDAWQAPEAVASTVCAHVDGAVWGACRRYVCSAQTVTLVYMSWVTSSLSHPPLLCRAPNLFENDQG